MINLIPFPAKNRIYDLIIRDVRNIVRAKQTNIAADTIAMESEIDHLVYQLYGLNEEEILVIERS